MKQRGFTLIETIITMSIFVVLVFIISSALNDIFVNSSQQMLSMGNIDQARTVLNMFTNEIRNSMTGSDGSYPLNQASDNQIVFYSNFGTNSTTVKRIRYYILNNTLYKGIVLPTGSPLTYNLSSESINIVMTNLSNGIFPAFYYYDGNYNGTTSALSQPVNINQVRFVKINLVVLNQIVRNSTNTFVASAGATIRSVKNNLGN